MPVVAMLEDKDELVLTAVQRAHPAIVLDPDTEVLELAIGVAAGGQQLAEMAPIHADEVDRAIGAEGREVLGSLAEKGSEGALSISPEAIGKGRWWIAPRPLAWPSIGTL